MKTTSRKNALSGTKPPQSHSVNTSNVCQIKPTPYPESPRITPAHTVGNRRVTLTDSEQSSTAGSISRFSDHAYLWEIDKFAERKDQATQNTQYRLIRSPSFTIDNTRRFELLLDLNGVNDGKGTHLSVYYRNLAGTEDHKLTWPYKQHIFLLAIAQKHPQSTIMQYAVNEILERPSIESPTKWHGYATFLSLQNLHNQQLGFIDKGALVIQCDILPAR